MGAMGFDRDWIAVGERDPIAVGKAVYAVAREKQLALASAGLAYHAFNSLVPLAILAVAGLSLVGGAGSAIDWVVSLAGLESAGDASTIEELVGRAEGRTRAAAIAGVVLVWSAARMFQAVNSAFGEVYGVRKRNEWYERTLETVLALATVAAAFLLLGLVGVALSFRFDRTALLTLTVPVLFAALFASFLPIYYLFPASTVSIREIVPGTAFAAVAWTVSGLGFRVYAQASESVELYGVAGAILLVLTWLYLGALAILLGAVLNALLAGHVEPEDEWMPTEEASVEAGEGDRADR